MFKSLSKWFNRPLDVSGHVYYAKLETPPGTFYKIGYTKKSCLVDRFSYANCVDEKLIKREFFFTFRPDAWEIEQALLEHFDRHRAFRIKDPAMPLCGRGQSELFHHDILGLDEDLYRIVDEEDVATLQASVEQKNAGCMWVLLGLALAPFTLGLSLLVIFLGASDFFGSDAGRPTGRQTTAKPTHPVRIRELIDSL